MKDDKRVINFGKGKEELTRFPSRAEVDHQFLHLSEEIARQADMLMTLQKETEAFVQKYNENVRTMNDTLTAFAEVIAWLKERVPDEGETIGTIN